jgi:hypothetical protein
MDARLFHVGILFVILASQSWNSATSQERVQPCSSGGSSALQSDDVARATATGVESPSVTADEGSKSLDSPCSSYGACNAELPCCKMCPRVYGEVEGLYLQRGADYPSRTILINANTQETLVSSSALGCDFEPGIRALFGFRLWGCRAVEFGYFGLCDTRSSLDYARPNQTVDVTLPGPLGVASNVFHDGVRVHMDEVSRIQGAEVNFPCCCCCCSDCPETERCGSTEWFAGFRYLGLRENLHISGEKTVLSDVETAYYDTNARNDLFGAQIGGRIRRCRGRFSWEATGKAGIFGNQAGQEQVFIDFPNFPLRPLVSANGGSVAFVGELNLTGIYQLNGVWGLRFGYNLMCIEGVALAPDQLDFSFTSTSGTGLNRSGSLFLHGVNVGLEARW